jgi:hypothetical protein
MHHLLAILSLFAVATGAATTQDPTAPPTYGEASLSSGFTPDPFRVDIQAGGSIDAAVSLRADCIGNISDAPDFDLYYNSGSFPLIISVAAQTDTTLVVRSASGDWHCDDDSGEGLNPSIRFDTPRSGLYDIWVGAHQDSTLEDATLSISELYSE